MDAERLAIGKALGVGVPFTRDFYRTSCFAFGRNLHEQLQHVNACAGIKGPTSLDTRYIFEDLPTNRVPLAPLGKVIGEENPRPKSETFERASRGG